ncbi:hypothetical protein GCM10009412_42160 [Aeromonas salmonicida subsp. achromogenes]
MGRALNPITNWSQYNRSLINRGSLTFWIDAEAMDNWFTKTITENGDAVSSTPTRASVPF